VIYTVSIRALQVAELLLSQMLFASGGAISHLRGQTGPDTHSDGLVIYTSVFMAIMVISFAMVAFANSGFVSLWVGAEHYAGQWFTVAIVSAGLGSMIVRFLQHVVFGMGKMKAASGLWTIESLLKALGLALLVPQLGVFGVPAATAFSAILVLPAVFVLASRTFGTAEVRGLIKLGTKGSRLVAVIALAAVVSPLAVRQSWWEWLVCGAAGSLVVAGLVLVVLPGLRREGVKVLRNLFKRVEPN